MRAATGSCDFCCYSAYPVSIAASERDSQPRFGEAASQCGTEASRSSHTHYPGDWGCRLISHNTLHESNRRYQLNSSVAACAGKDCRGRGAIWATSIELRSSMLVRSSVKMNRHFWLCMT